MITTTTLVKKELESLLKLAPSIRPFGIWVKLDHIIGDSAWWTTLNLLGFDDTVISLNTSSSTNSQKACKKESNAYLQDGEKEKFNQKGHTEKDI